jgi:hypothetical protein
MKMHVAQASACVFFFNSHDVQTHQRPVIACRRLRGAVCSLPNHRQRSSHCYFSVPAARRCRWIRGSSSATSHPQEYLPAELSGAAQLRVAAIAPTEAQSKCHIQPIPPPFQTTRNSIQSKCTSAESSSCSLLTRFLQFHFTAYANSSAHRKLSPLPSPISHPQP